MKVIVKSVVPQDTILADSSFYCRAYVNDIGKDITSDIRLVADDCILYRCINNSNKSEALQSDLQRLVEWCPTRQIINCSFGTRKHTTM